VVEPTSPSPIVGVFVRAVQELLPVDQKAKLEPFKDAIEGTTSAKDGHRARHCALWAIQLADDKDLANPRWREIKQLHQVWKDAWLGVQYGLHHTDTGHHPIEDVEIEWTEGAVEVAKMVGEADGWEHAPWEKLLGELIEMEPK
jgi:hypothetical protein